MSLTQLYLFSLGHSTDTVEHVYGGFKRVYFTLSLTLIHMHVQWGLKRPFAHVENKLHSEGYACGCDKLSRSFVGSVRATGSPQDTCRSFVWRETWNTLMLQAALELNCWKRIKNLACAFGFISCHYTLKIFFFFFGAANNALAVIREATGYSLTGHAAQNGKANRRIFLFPRADSSELFIIC